MDIIQIHKYISLLLIPFIPIYLLIFYLKRSITRQKKFNIPIICIGNITTGGTGKTPAVIELAKILISTGYHPGIVSRGYHGTRSKEGAIVADGNKLLLTPVESGDEPFLVAKSLKNVPVAICSSRSKAINSLIDKFQVDTIIMDDGFQNNSVYKNISIAMIDATNPFGNRLILPAGNLREPEESLRRSDLIIINNSELVSNKQLVYLTSKIKRISQGKAIFYSNYQNDFLYQMKNPKSRIQLSGIKNKKILIVTGIANPTAFATAIKKYDPYYVSAVTFSDHHVYTLKEIKKFLKESDSFNLVITTEKDYVKMADFQFNEKFYVLKISLLIKEPDIFKNVIKSLLKDIK